MKNVKPIIKSQTRVKSMFAFLDEENDNKEKVDYNSVDEEQNASDEEMNVIEDVEEMESEPQKNDGPVVLKRGRGNKVVDKVDKPLKTVAVEPKKKPSKIVEVGSETYDGQPKEKVKMTFAFWWKNLWLKLKSWWDLFIQKKGAIRFVIMLGVMIVVMLGIIIYSFVSRTSITDLFQNKTSAFVISENENSGQGSVQTLSLKDFTKDKVTNDNTQSFQYIDFYGKDLDKTKSLQSLNFIVKTIFEDVSLKISLEIYYANDMHLMIEPKRVDLSKNVAKYVELKIDQSIKFDDTTVFRIIFDSVKTSDLNDILETPYDVDFSVYKLTYRA